MLSIQGGALAVASRDRRGWAAECSESGTDDEQKDYIHECWSGICRQLGKS